MHRTLLHAHRHFTFNPELLTIKGAVGSFKPAGLWYGFNDSWLKWCEWCWEEKHVRNKKKWIHLLDLDTSDILRITTKDALVKFSNEFGCSICNIPNRKDGIDWDAVMQKWKGIEIVPHFYSIRLKPNYLWYSGWDCASGVFWHPDVFKGIIGTKMSSEVRGKDKELNEG